MKLNFKASSQDWLIFGAFAFLLLYLVAIVVLNLSFIATEGSFYGLSPFLAFTPKYIGVTIIFYIFALVFLFVTVSSYFFDASKGIGISVGGKDEKGYSRLLTTEEMKKELKKVKILDENYDAAGFPIVIDKKNIWVDNGESHNIVVGVTGSGKTQCIIHPLVKVLAKKGESMIITDPKGEIYSENAGILKQRGYKIIVLNFRNPQKGNQWNPLALPYDLYTSGNVDKALELLDDVATNILYEEGQSKDAFWEKTSADYFAGLSLGLFDDAKKEEVNINSISLISSVGEEKYNVRNTYIKEYFNKKDPASAAYTCASGTIIAPDDTKNSILSTFKQKVRIFASRENLSEMLSESDFDIRKIGTEKTAIFLVIQDEKKTYHALATIFIKQCYESLIDVAQTYPKSALPVRTNFILDEFANMPPLKDVTTMITAARSRQIRFTMIIQNFAQLDQVYGKENAQTIRSNCGNLLYLLTTELAALNEISELCGEKKVTVGKGDKAHEENRPLITVSDLQKMKQFEAIVIRQRKNPFRTILTPNFKINWGLEKIDADPYVERAKKPIKMFDLKEFVKNSASDKTTSETNDFMKKFNSNAETNLGQSKPINKTQNNPSPSKEGSLNIESLMQKIDSRIKELETKEEPDNEKIISSINKPLNTIGTQNVVTDTNKKTLVQNATLVQNENSTLTEPNYSNTNDTKSIHDIFEENKNAAKKDDQFFDDFFDE